MFVFNVEQDAGLLSLIVRKLENTKQTDLDTYISVSAKVNETLGAADEVLSQVLSRNYSML